MDVRLNIFQQMRKSKYTKLISLLFIITFLSLRFSFKSVMADGDGKVSDLEYDLTGAWEQPGYGGKWNIIQSSGDIIAHYDAPNEKGTAKGKLKKDKVFFVFENSSQNHQAHGTPEDFLNSGKLECDILDDSNKLQCKITQSKQVGTSYVFILIRKVKKTDTDAKVTELHFIQKTDSGYLEIHEISYNEPFYIKAEYNSESQEKKKTVTLDWGMGLGKKIIVNQQTDKKIYLSGPIRAKRPDSSKEGK